MTAQEIMEPTVANVFRSMSFAAGTFWICDIDGTLAVMHHRGPYEWSRVGEDLPNWPVIIVINALIDAGAKIIFVSGRMEECRRQTEMWLRTYIHIQPEEEIDLRMRPDDDYRPDQDLKFGILQDIEMAGIGPIVGVFDDRESVIPMWKAASLFVFDVGRQRQA